MPGVFRSTVTQKSDERVGGTAKNNFGPGEIHVRFNLQFNLKWHSNEDCSPYTSRCCGWRGAGFRAGDRGRTLQCSGPSCPSGIHRYYGRNVSACRPISSLGSGGCRPGLECNNVRQHLGRQTDWKSIGGRRSDPHLNVCDRIQRLQAPVRDVVKGRNAELFPCGVLLGRRTQSTEVLACGRLEYRVAC